MDLVPSGKERGRVTRHRLVLGRGSATSYSPRLHRFISEDPLGLGAGEPNLYEYVRGDPVNTLDPTGLGWSDWEDWDLSAVSDFAAGLEAALHEIRRSGRLLRPHRRPDALAPARDALEAELAHQPGDALLPTLTP